VVDLVSGTADERRLRAHRARTERTDHRELGRHSVKS
jgi:hypothetical protein